VLEAVFVGALALASLVTGLSSGYVVRALLRH
jgi:hypothetical protein